MWKEVIKNGKKQKVQNFNNLPSDFYGSVLPEDRPDNFKTRLAREVLLESGYPVTLSECVMPILRFLIKSGLFI